MQTINSYKELKVWQAAIELAVSVYKATGGFPKDELYGLTSQMRRAAGSVAANIAEGHGRETTANFIQFLRIAQGSLKELETHLIIAYKVGILPMEIFEVLMLQSDDIGRMLRALIRSLQDKL
ncbi:four helix bundle protein [Shinella pollutisoli]|uniref:Four helix bundle protein n=1 Tax=Shinella pollutisoli TaxID=2250594 RepID=A0ABV7DAE9_9HYPH|nr:four helix bundle protein [Shinella pollutisoli]